MKRKSIKLCEAPVSRRAVVWKICPFINIENGKNKQELVFFLFFNIIGIGERVFPNFFVNHKARGLRKQDHILRFRFFTLHEAQKDTARIGSDFLG